MGSESTEVGYRIRGIEPPDLVKYPDSVKKMYWQWVVDLGLIAKDRELVRGLTRMANRCGRCVPSRSRGRAKWGPHSRPLHRSSHRTARWVRSLDRAGPHELRGVLVEVRQCIGRSFATILHYQQEQGAMCRALRCGHGASAA